MTRCPQVLIIAGCVLITACGGGAPTPATGAKAKPPNDQVVLSADEQATGKIETQPVGMSESPDVLRVSGRIARADDRTWRSLPGGVAIARVR